MDIHEYQAKELLSRYSRARFRAADWPTAPSRRPTGRSEIGGSKWVVKAQIHSGARGKAGGIKHLRVRRRGRPTPPKPCSARKLVTHQTGPHGKLVSRLYVEEAVDIRQEIYLGFVLDRESRARHDRRLGFRRHGDRGDRRSQPDSIIRATVDPGVGMQQFQAREIAFGLGLENSLIGKADRTRSSAATACSAISTPPCWRSIRWW